jgi:glycosyltransferase involved in cell wall biosynthesis
MKENDISTIIHSRNNPNILREVLESLYEQTVSAGEIIIVHTGSVQIDERMIHSYFE